MTDAVTAVAEPVAEFLRAQVGIPSGKVRTIQNGVDIPRFRSAHPINRSALGWGDENVVIGCVARLEPEKGHTILLDAFRRVYARRPHARLLLIGGGSERQRLELLSSNFGLNGSVQFLGSRADIPELLGACDLVTLASIQEGLPMALLEAMAAGKPVVATKVGIVPELVQGGQTGLLVPPGNAELLAEALDTLITDPMRGQRLAAAALDLVKMNYSFDRTLEQYTALYDAILSGKRN
jgi:glycosyltransferase involved in cell wall biosynthesis